MKNTGLLFKEISESQIKNNLKGSESIFVIRYSKVSSPDLSALRRSLRNTQARLLVVKNSVARRALKSSGLELLLKGIEGPCGLVFVKEEPVGTSRLLYNFAKEHEQLKLEAGFLKDKILQPSDIERLARLPTKEVLRAQAVWALKSPISGLVIALNQMLRKLVVCLEQVKNKKAG